VFECRVNVSQYRSVVMCQTITARLSGEDNRPNNNHDNVYDAIIMTKVIARVRPVYFMTVD